MKHTSMKAGIIMLLVSAFATQAFGQELAVHGKFKHMMHTASIRAMVPAHFATMNGVEGWDMQAEEADSGAIKTVT